MFRIDPINEQGNVDLEFFGSDYYSEESRVLQNYLKLEGFEEIKKTFFIDFRNRKWQVTKTKN